MYCYFIKKKLFDTPTKEQTTLQNHQFTLLNFTQGLTNAIVLGLIQLSFT